MWQIFENGKWKKQLQNWDLTLNEIKRDLKIFNWRYKNRRKKNAESGKTDEKKIERWRENEKERNGWIKRKQ